VLEMRRQYSGYFKGFRNASKLRHLLMQEDTKEGVLDVMLSFNPDAPDIQLPRAELPTRRVKDVTEKEHPSAESANVKKAQLPEAMAGG
jgi:hypothetical protein